MILRATHHGYAHQDLITGIAFVDLALGSAESITVDTKGFPADRFDDVTINYRSGRRIRLQIKHTVIDRALARATLSADNRSLKLDKLLDSLLTDLASAPGTTYRVVVCDGGPDSDLSSVLKLVDPADDPGDPLPGVATRRHRFDPNALRTIAPWTNLVEHLTDQQLRDACRQLVVDTNAPASSLSFVNPGPVERALLRRATEELGAGRAPNSGISPEYVARALADAATTARATDGTVVRQKLLPELGLVTDFGAVAEGHPVEAAVAVRRAGAAAEVAKQIDAVTPVGGRIVVVGEPGVGKSWLCEQLADTYRGQDWIVARHHCWLGSGDDNRVQRVLTEVVIGSLLRQLEQAAPDSTAGLRPRFTASAEALAAAAKNCREAQGRKNVLLIVDGLDHVDRVLGRVTNQQTDPSRLLVDQLAKIDVPPGVSLLIASQPGPHLVNANPAASTGGPVQLPRMSWDEVHTLASKHGLLEPLAGGEPLDEDDERTIVDLVYDRSGGNALYATYLCRHATRVSPLEAGDQVPLTVNDIVRRLTQVPVSVKDIDAYYGHLLSGMTDGQLYAIGTLALCDFALSAYELGEVLPAVKPLIQPALATLAPVLNSQPSLGGLRIHHESFSRHILRDRDAEWAITIRGEAAAWLTARGFFTDARAFRHLPEILAHLDRYAELKALIQPGFVASAIEAFQPPEALVKVVGVVARESQRRLDWPTLISCVETRKSIDTYENESLTDSIVEYADVIVSVVGVEVVVERLLYEGRTTFEARWGLRICAAVDRAGAAAPWKAYMDAFDAASERESGTYSSDSDGTLQLALECGAIRLRAQRRDFPAGFEGDIAEHLQRDHQASLPDLVRVFAAGLPAYLMVKVAAAMSDPDKAAQIYLTLADLAANGEPGLPVAAELAREAWTRAPSLSIDQYLKHGIAASDVAAGLGITDLDDELLTATKMVLSSGSGREENVQKWLSLFTLAHAIDRTIPVKYLSHLSGAGFYRSWLRYAVSTIGIADDVASGAMTPEAASTTVLVALGDVASESQHPFVGDPNASRLYFIHPLIHRVIEDSLKVVQPADLDAVLDHLISIGDGTTTVTNLGTPPSGPLITNDLLGILSKVSEHIGVTAVHSLLAVIRERHDDSHAGYGESADFELAAARICHEAGSTSEAAQSWRHACQLLSGYGGHKDPTLSELTDSIHDIANVDLNLARDGLAKLVDLVYLISQHTDGRDTSHYADRWWECATDIDPIAAALDGADILVHAVGLEDSRVQTAHSHLLAHQTATGDPIALAALRLTAGISWSQPSTDTELLIRLTGELGASPQVNAMLAVVANTVAASYDDQSLMYSSSQPSTVATAELVDAVVALGGPSFPARVPRSEPNKKSPFDAGLRSDPLELQRRIVNGQRPVVPEGRAGVLLATRDHQDKRHSDDATAPRWDLDALANTIGWRIIEATVNHGADAGIDLIEDVARGVATHSDNEILAAVGEGLALRIVADMPDSMKKVAAYALTRAYIRIRGGGGWRTFAGRERADLWSKAYAIDPTTAEATLAAAVVETVASDAQRSYGVTQAVVAAFSVTPTTTPGGTATECWTAAFSIIAHRLPGQAKRFGHTYRPTTTPGTSEELDVAMATLAVAAIAQPMRSDLRQALLAAALLLTCRPVLGQAAIASTLAGDLDAGRATWLLDVVRSFLPAGALSEDLATVLTNLAGVDVLSVRALAAAILSVHERPLPNLPATEPAPPIRAAFHELMRERG
jgi:hypothetical protein